MGKSLCCTTLMLNVLLSEKTQDKHLQDNN